jgi:hypothetical protein
VSIKATIEQLGAKFWNWVCDHMLDSEQDWIDKYRAATADVKPPAGARLGKWMRRLAGNVCRGFGEIAIKRRRNQLSTAEPAGGSSSASAVLKSAQEGDDAA